MLLLLKKDEKTMPHFRTIYRIFFLFSSIDAALKVREELEPICKVPLITSSREEQQLIASTSKVREHKSLKFGGVKVRENKSLTLDGIQGNCT